MLRNRFKSRDNATTNVASIMMGALLFGLAVGLPTGYLARQMYAAAPNSDLASLQQK